jgi:hypothetical protein
MRYKVGTTFKNGKYLIGTVIGVNYEGRYKMEWLFLDRDRITNNSWSEEGLNDLEVIPSPMPKIKLPEELFEL